MLHTYNGILFRLIKQGNSDTYYHMNKLWRHYTKQNKPVIKIKILCDASYMSYPKSSSTERESRVVVAKDPEDRGWAVSVWWGCILFEEGGHTRMWMYLTSLNCAFKSGWNGKFYYEYFTRFFNKDSVRGDPFLPCDSPMENDWDRVFNLLCQ